jgi:hypothetical protein
MNSLPVFHSIAGYLVPVALLVTAVIHLLPLIGALGVHRLQRLYGISIAEPNLAILMRHRAVLFGMLGGFLLLAAFVPSLQPAAFALGLVRVVSFLLLAWTTGGYNANLTRVVTADIVALVSLIIGFVAYLILHPPKF